MKINLTQHQATPEQMNAGIVDLDPVSMRELARLLTFDDIPAPSDVVCRAREIATFAAERAPMATYAMIGGAPYLMGALERELLKVGITPMYAFSRRESAEEVQLDGSTRKVAVFRHIGFVEAAAVINKEGT